MNTYFSERATALLRQWLSRDGWFRQSGEAEDGFWKFAVAMLQDTDGAGERPSIVEIIGASGRRVRTSTAQTAPTMWRSTAS